MSKIKKVISGIKKRKSSSNRGSTLPYSVIDGKLVFTRINRVSSRKPPKNLITDQEIVQLNLQRLIIKRSSEIVKGALSKQYK